MRIAVVGAGIFGLATSLELRAREHTVCLFEQGSVPNPHASSTDHSKTIRRDGYGRVSEYVELVERSALQWERWHEQIGEIYFRVGKLHVTRHFEPETLSYMSWERFKDEPLGSRMLSRREAEDRFPQFAYYDEDVIIHDAWSGYVRSGVALAGLASIAQEEGVQILPDTTVLEIVEDFTSVRIQHGGGNSGFDMAVVCGGPWVGRLIPALAEHLSITRQEMAFFKPSDPESFRREVTPIWSFDPYQDGWYGFPLLHEGFVKVAMEKRVHEVDADVERIATPAFLAEASRMVDARVPGLAEGELVGSRCCLYTNTPDHDFIIDRAPRYQHTVVAGGGSGHGFKFGGSIGPLVADVVEDRENPLGKIFRIGERLNA